MEDGPAWFSTLDKAMDYARTHPGAVVVKCAKGEVGEFASITSAQFLARLLTRKGSVVWQGIELVPVG